MGHTITPEDFVFFRQNTLSLDDYPPSRLSFKELKTVLSASVRDFDLAVKRLMQGKRIRTRYGTYWAEHKKV